MTVTVVENSRMDHLIHADIQFIDRRWKRQGQFPFVDEPEVMNWQSMKDRKHWSILIARIRFEEHIQNYVLEGIHAVEQWRGIPAHWPLA